MSNKPALRVEVKVVEARQARARWANGQLMVRIPHHWPLAEREAAIARFTRWAQQRLGQEEHLDAAWKEWAQKGPGRRWTPSAFDAHVRELNAATLAVPLQGVRIGQAKHSRLAQCNPRTQVLTFSRHAIDGMPMAPLRYLIVHELAHMLEANHSARFWALVAAHEANWQSLRLVAQHHHARAVAELGQAGPPFWAQSLQEAHSAPASKPMPHREAKKLEPGAHPFDALFRFPPELQDSSSTEGEDWGPLFGGAGGDWGPLFLGAAALDSAK